MPRILCSVSHGHILMLLPLGLLFQMTGHRSFCEGTVSSLGGSCHILWHMCLWFLITLYKCQSHF